MRNEKLFKVLRRMKAAQEDFFFDGEWTAIRRIDLTPALEAHLAASFGRLLVQFRDNAMQVGMLLVSEMQVSPEYDSQRNLLYLVLTLEGFCPHSQAAFDVMVFPAA